MTTGLYLPDGTFMRFSESSTSLREEIAVRSRSIDFFAVGNLYLPNPDPVLKAQGKDIQVYSDLRVDDRVSGGMTNRFNSTLALDWRIDRGSGGKSRQVRAVQTIFERLPLARVMADILQARAFGYAPLEIIWDQRDGLIVPVDVQLKPHRWFVFGQAGELRFRSREHMMDGEALPPRKFLCPVSEASYENPYGLGLLSRCFWPVVFKKGGWRFWIQFGEKYGQVWPIGKLPRQASTEQVNDLLDVLTRLIQDGAAVIPDDGSVDFKESGTKGATSALYRDIIAEANNAISTVWLGHAGAGESVPGELGGKSVAVDVRADLRDSDKTLVEQTLNQLIDWICEINWSSAEGAPRLSLREEEEVDGRQAARDKDLTESLARSGLRLTRAYFLREYNLEDGDIAEAAQEQSGPAGADAAPVQFAEAAGPDSADILADRLDTEASPVIARWIEALRHEADRTDSLATLRQGLLSAAAQLDLAGLAEPIRNGLLLATLAGQAEILDEIAASEAGSMFAEPAVLAALHLPFDEAVRFFRQKISIPTERWNDLFLDQHSKGFMIAGAMKGELLADLRDAVDQTIGNGLTLAAFRKQWDQIVESHGWQYTGGRNWRTRVVYETNTRQAYNAGRWQQATDPDVLRTRPYLIYRHGDSIHPRPLHLAWNGICLPADDAFWETHTPQNGWGCQCKIFSGGERDLKRLGAAAKLKAPSDGTYVWTDRQGRSFTIPNGIDPGFQYNPGAAARQSRDILNERLDQLPPDIAAPIRAEITRGQTR